MTSRIETPDDVCALLAQRFRGRGLFRATRREVEAELNWRRRFLATDDEAWRALMLRAECVAERSSIRERYLAHGWTMSRFERAWRRGAATIAAGLVTRRDNPAAIDANLDAEERLIRQGRIAPVLGSPPLYRST